MLYNTGTIAISGNTATGTGTNWTAPASQVRAGQTIIVMSNPIQMFQISAVNSATSMTVTPAASPALSGQKYGILVSDNISVDGLAQAMSQLINEYDENIGAWETFATTTANQSITVTINGKAVTIPAIGKLLQKGSNNALAVADGGTGATKAEDARTNLGLGSIATLNKDQVPLLAAGNVFSASQTFETTGSYLSLVLNSKSNDDSVVGTKNFLEVAGSVPGSQPLFYVVRRNQLNSTGQKVIQFPDAAGTIALTGTSDISYKKDIVDYDGLDSVEKILSLELKKFVYIDDEKGRTRRGIIAQQAQIVEPLYVKRTFEPDGTEQFDEKGNKISQALRERLVIDTNALQMDLLCALQVALRKIDSLEKLITKSAAADSSAG